MDREKKRERERNSEQSLIAIVAIPGNENCGIIVSRVRMMGLSTNLLPAGFLSEVNEALENK